MHFDAPKIQASQIDQNLNRQSVQFTLDMNSRIVHHLGQQNNFFYFEKITPYLFTENGEPPKKAEGQCGEISYVPTPIKEIPSIILWKEI